MVIQKIRQQQPATAAVSISVIVPTLNEGKYLDRCLASLTFQSLPRHKYEIILADSKSSDATVTIGKQYGVSILDCPAGKLTARDLATRATKSDIIVAADADTYYPHSWLENTVKPLLKKGIVGVTGPRLYSGGGQLSGLFNAGTYAFGAKTFRFYGSNSAFRRTSYFMAGGFDLSINQQDSKAMVEEEEVLFKVRLEAFGKIVYTHDNPVYTSLRRFEHTDKQYEDSRLNRTRF